MNALAELLRVLVQSPTDAETRRIVVSLFQDVYKCIDSARLESNHGDMVVMACSCGVIASVALGLYLDSRKLRRRIEALEALKTEECAGIIRDR
jgi:hypothetical protein